MDIFQKNLMSKGIIELVTPNGARRLSLGDGRLVLKQDEDMTVGGYSLRISNGTVAAAYAVTDGNETEFGRSGADLLHEIDFAHGIGGVRIVFRNGLADDLTVPVDCVAADAGAYYAKQREHEKAQTAERVALRCATGANLVNVYFQPGSDEFHYAEVTFYVPNKTQRVTVGGPYGPESKIQVLSWMRIAVRRAAEGDWFLSLGGLAPGMYAYILRQYDRFGGLIYESEMKEFKI